jgi:4-diphosphocytidyl-2-C-methyl-D-erythritol kinase
MFLARHARVAPSTEELRSVALELGSDVPFFLKGGTCYASGRGESLEELAEQNATPLLVVLPDESVMTGEAYALLRSARDGGIVPDGTAIGFERCHELARRGLLSDTTLLVNDFEDAIFAARPSLGTIFERVRATGAIWTRLSGSGSAIVGAFDSTGRRNRAAEWLSDSLTVLPALAMNGAATA